MEAVPPLPLLSFELKTSPEVTQFGPKLKQYILEAYREDPESYNNEIYQLAGLRSAAVRATLDSEGLSNLYKYFCQLRSMQSRFPMAKGQPAACTFAWRDIYANMTCTLTDVRFEMASILYNIGAVHTKLGSTEPRDSPESLKAACTHFQKAAWAFQHLRDQYLQPQGVDVSADIIRLLQKICFAQAQECILEKSIQDTKKPSVIGAVATQVLIDYKNAITLLGPPSPIDNIYEVIGREMFQHWQRNLTFKVAYVNCIVCLYQGMQAEEQQKMGERVAFYQLALSKLNEAQKLAKYVQPVQMTKEALSFTHDVVEGKYKAAKNENEFIYHEEVPDKDVLPEMKPVCLVKALEPNFNDPEVTGTDLFAKLVPMGAHEASSVYSEEKAKLLRGVVSQVENKDMELDEFMSSLQLEQLDVLELDQTIPQEIVDRCAAMNAKTEIIQSLVDSMNNLAEIISDVEHTLADIKGMIQEETVKEKEYQKVMGPRPPSIVQTELSREFHKYQEAHSRTNESNQVLHKAMTLHIANLRLLSQPLDVLKSKIPSVDNIEGLDTGAMAETRRVARAAAAMRAQRGALLAALRSALQEDDVTPRLLAHQHQSDDIFHDELEKHTPQIKIIEQNLAAQENIINRLTTLYASYGDSRRLLSEVLRKREGLINALITSYDSYGELLAKSQKGVEFYKKLCHNANQLLARLKSNIQVLDEEREQHLRNQKKTSVPASVPTSLDNASADLPPMPVVGGTGLKLKDFLPYMKNRNLARNLSPQAPAPLADTYPGESYYPESIYPTSIRPAPVGSEATDMPLLKPPDGVVVPPAMQSINPNDPYNQYQKPYGSADINPYANYAYPGSSKDYDVPANETYNVGSYTSLQATSQMSNINYGNPYYPSTHDGVSDSHNPLSYPANMMSQYTVHSDAYGRHITPIPESPSISLVSQVGLSANFSQMQLTTPKEVNGEPVLGASELSQNPYVLQNPHVVNSANNNYPAGTLPNPISMTPQAITDTYPYSNDPNVGQYMQPAVNVPQPFIGNNSQVPTSYGQNIPYSAGQNVPDTYVNNPTASSYCADTPYSYTANISSSYENVPQGYNQTNADSNIQYITTNVTNAPVTVPQPYSIPSDAEKIDPAILSQLDAMDKPIKSHVTGEALSSHINYQNYQKNTSVPNQMQYQNPEQNNSPYAQNFQNHPGYTFNVSTGNYDYSYGSQNTYNEYSTATPEQNWNNGVYTSAGTYDTVQSPSANESVPPLGQANNQLYYNNPYGYQTADQSNEVPLDTEPNSTNYGANINQSTYMQSGHGQDTNVTYSNNQNQVSTSKEEVQNPPDHDQTSANDSQSTLEANSVNYQSTLEATEESAEADSVPIEVESQTEKQTLEPKPEASAFDLLSEIDFSVEQTPLMPEIKVPQVPESVYKRPAVSKPEVKHKPQPVEDVIERPAKVDLFSPSLLNKFTQEVKNLQKFVDSLTNKMPGGLTLLDSKWKSLQDFQGKELASRTTYTAMQYSQANTLTDVVPYDDSRLTIKSESSIYFNASFYPQLASWCIPLVISKTPVDNEIDIFWSAILENKITCVICLLTEIEIQGGAYWPTAKGQCLDLSGGVKVTLEEVTCTVHWTERKLTVTAGKTTTNIAHYQINVFPAKIVCTPLVLLADKILSQTYNNRLSNQLSGAWVHCNAGAGRSSVVTLLLMVMCQVRAGQLNLCEMLDSGCTNLYKRRTNVLEDTKYLADAYRAVLFYVQGVLCSGTTMFNGETVTSQSGASVLPPATPIPTTSSTSAKPLKFSRESFEEMKQSPGLKSGDMKDPLNFLDPLWSLKKK